MTLGGRKIHVILSDIFLCISFTLLALFVFPSLVRAVIRFTCDTG